jgi:hypothetical protein
MLKYKVTTCKGKDLKPGELFTTAGQEYWDRVSTTSSIGEKVFVRTDAPVPNEFEANADVFKLEVEIIREEIK